jgi:hypothetical protein
MANGEFSPLEQITRTLEATWWILTEEPGMDDIAEQAGDSLKKMIGDLKVHPFQDYHGGSRLFLARFEFPKYQAQFQYPEAVFLQTALAFIDFLGGFPVDDCEMLVAIGEASSKPETISVKEVENPDTRITPPMPDILFSWPEPEKLMFNLTALPVKDWTKMMAKNLQGESAPKNVHWWLRLNLTENFITKEGDQRVIKYPAPGEFLGLGVRIMPDCPYGHQGSSPFIYSGNWMDTVYYTCAVIKEVIEPTDEAAWKSYKVQWRANPNSPGSTGEMVITPSDFAEYQVGERVAILKDVATEKQSQLWKDDDMKNSGDKFPDPWQIVPITFYQQEE